MVGWGRRCGGAEGGVGQEMVWWGRIWWGEAGDGGAGRRWWSGIRREQEGGEKLTMCSERLGVL